MLFPNGEDTIEAGAIVAHGRKSVACTCVTFSDHIPAKRRTLQAGRNRKKRSPYAKGLPGTTYAPLLPSLPNWDSSLSPCSIAARAHPMFVHARPSSSFLSPKKGPEPKVTAVAAE